jgi:hypothetical protein
LGQTSQALVAEAAESFRKERPAPKTGLEIRTMKVKTLLLSSAAAFAAVGGAQAADLSIAEPIDYVRVCDAMGTGFWYIPGTDTCLRIGGEVSFSVTASNEWEVLLGEDHDEDSVSGTATVTIQVSGDHSSHWTFETSATVEVDARSMTEFGVLTAFIQMEATSDNSQFEEEKFLTESGSAIPIDSERIFTLEEAYIELGFFKAGYFDSEFRGPGDYNGVAGVGEYRPGANTVDQVLLTWAMNGFSASLSVEDPRDNFGTDLPIEYELPVIVAVLAAELGPFDNRFSGAIGPRGDDFGEEYLAWGANATTTIDLSDLGDLRLSAYFGNDDEWVDEAENGDGLFNWSGFASWNMDVAPSTNIGLTVAYADPDGADSIWEAFGEVEFEVLNNTTFTVGAGWESRDDGVWSVGAEWETELVPDEFTTTLSGEYHAESGAGDPAEWEVSWEASREFGAN